MPTQPFYTSSKFWGIAIGVIAVILQMFGITVDITLSDEVMVTVNEIAAILGQAVALFSCFNKGSKPLNIS